MSKIIISKINNCKDCPLCITSTYPTSDSWERAEYWWCSHPKNELVKCNTTEDERNRLYISKQNNLENIRKIRGYVEWHEEKKIKIPEWCKLDNE